MVINPNKNKEITLPHTQPQISIFFSGENPISVETKSLSSSGVNLLYDLDGYTLGPRDDKSTVNKSLRNTTSILLVMNFVLKLLISGKSATRKLLRKCNF